MRLAVRGALVVVLCHLSGPTIAAQLPFDHEQLLDFVPRYRTAECLVKIEAVFPSREQRPLYVVEWALEAAIIATRKRLEPEVLLGSLFFRRAVTSEFRPHHTVVNLERYFGYLHYGIECERRFEITERIVRAVNASMKGYTLHIVDATDEEAGWRLGSPFWIDSLDYDPVLWDLAKRMWKGDPEAMLALGEGALAAGHPEGAFRLLTLAAERLPEGPERERAAAGRDRAWEKIPEEYRAQARAAVERNREELPLRK